MPTKITQEQLYGFIRYAMMAAAAKCVQHGFFSSATENQITEALLFVLPFVWSFIEKREGAKLDKAIDIVNDALAAGAVAHSAVPGEAPAVVKILPAGAAAVVPPPVAT